MDFELSSNCGGSSNHVDNPIVPLFLLKTFSILDSADPDVVSWSDEGDSFIVKDIESFSTEVIPVHFKHNKFSSFVRQLNFYGFRKVKGKLTVVGATTCSWEFRHPAFLKGQPELLENIKRSSSRGNAHAQPRGGNGAAAAEVHTIDSLMQQVADLNNMVIEMARSAEEMRLVIAEYQRQEAERASAMEAEASNMGDEWGGIDDDDLLLEFIEDHTQSPAPADADRVLKRHRSVDDFSSVLEEPAAKKSTPNYGVNVSDPDSIKNVVNSIAHNMAGSDVSVSFDQYVSAVGAILSCAGMSQPAGEVEPAATRKEKLSFDVRGVSSALLAHSL